MLLLLLLAAPPETALVAAVEKVAAPTPAMHGLIHLLGGNKSAARLALAQEPDLAAYLAMAELDGPGGLGRARETLAKAAQREDAPANVLFLAALAFAASGDPKKADELLSRALAKSTSALDEAFAPDPAVALVRLAAESKDADRAALARALLAAGRRHAAIELAEEIDAREVLVEAWAPIDPRRALRFANDPGWRARLHFQLGEKDRAKAALQEVTAESAATERLRAALLLDEGKPNDALAVAQEAARVDPSSDEAVRLVAEALLATGASDRAHAFAEELLRRKPIEIDPFGVLARIQIERKQRREVAALEARSRGHREQREKLAKVRRRREAILSAVRDAEAGLGATGLEALRGADPELSLTIDLALGRLGRSGTARAARDRVLAACGDDLRKLLSVIGPWDRARIEVSPYGKVQKAEAPLSGADPGRCGGRVLRK